MVAEGMTTDEILVTYPDLEPGDVQESLHSAAEAVRERELPLAGWSSSSTTDAGSRIFDF
jgi:hypothetical protein